MKRKAFPVLLVLIAAPLLLVGVNLHTFHRLTDEAPIARLRFVELEPQRYQMEVRTGDFCNPQHFGNQFRCNPFVHFSNLINFSLPQ